MPMWSQVADISPDSEPDTFPKVDSFDPRRIILLIAFSSIPSSDVDASDGVHQQVNGEVEP